MTKAKSSFKSCFLLNHIRVTETPEEIKELFNQYSQNGTMSINHLLKFMTDYQKESNATREDAQEIFNSLKHHNILQHRGLNLDAFFRYLLGDHNVPLPSKVHHDMDAPLSHYFVYTSHKTYLTGNEFSRDYSVDPIIKALKKGVRVIELDLWPNSENTDVKVVRGRTLTASVDLIKCLRAIKDYAFVASEYPVVINFEDHLTPNLQALVAKMVKKTFGTMLYYPDYENKFPSPNYLKKKVLISSLSLEEYMEIQGSKYEGSSQKTSTSSAEKVPQRQESFSEILHETNDEDQQDSGQFTAVEDKAGQAAPAYGYLIAIHAMKSKKLNAGLGSWSSNKVGRLSMGDQQLKNSMTHRNDILKFTLRNILRICPTGTNFSPSNYDPCVWWMHGAQMVALNMKDLGKYLWITQGMFKANGGCGYVKKPNFLLKHNPDYDVYKSSERLQSKIILKVKIYLGEGWHLDFPKTDFDRHSPPKLSAKTEIAGVAAYEVMPATVTANDWIAAWNAEFEFPLVFPELAVLSIEVLIHNTDEKPDFGGQTCLPISELKSGIRAVPLYDRSGDPYKNTRLLMRFELLY